MPQNSDFWLLRGHRFGQKIEFTVWHQITVGNHYGPSWGQWGSHWDKKMGQNGKNLPCPNIRIFDYSVVIDLGKKSN